MEESTVKDKSKDVNSVTPEKQLSPTIPGLHLSILSKSQLKKLRKNKAKEASKNAPSNVNMNEFEFVSVEVNDIESRENKPVRNYP